MVRLFNSLPAPKFGFLAEKGGQELVVDRDLASPLPFRHPAGIERNLGYSALEMKPHPGLKPGVSALWHNLAMGYYAGHECTF